jgi:hypothetical protein
LRVAFEVKRLRDFFFRLPGFPDQLLNRWHWVCALPLITRVAPLWFAVFTQRLLRPKDNKTRCRSLRSGWATEDRPIIVGRILTTTIMMPDQGQIPGQMQRSIGRSIWCQQRLTDAKPVGFNAFCYSRA